MPGVWKLNNSLLSDEKFCKLIRETILEHIEFLLAFDNIQAWWEFLKTSIKEVSIGFARNKLRQLWWPMGAIAKSTIVFLFLL